MNFFTQNPTRKLLILTALLLLSLGAVSCKDDGPVSPPGNQAPGTPIINTVAGGPADGATDILPTAHLNWSCSDPDGDSLVFTVNFGTSATPAAVSTDQAATSYDPNLNYETTYYWQILASDPDGETTSSPVWSFTTGSQALETISQPDAPEGPTSGYLDVALDFTASGATSSLGHDVWYRFDWGDGSLSDWVDSTQFTYSWTAEGTYAVKTQARSSVTPSIESQWSDALSVEITSVPETISMSFNFSGDVHIGAGETHEYSISSMPISSEGHPVEIQFVWGDGSATDWMTDLAATHAWASEGSYSLDIRARCSIHTNVVEEWLNIRTIEVAAQEIITGTHLNPAVGDNSMSNVSYPISCTCQSSFGHPTEIRIDFGDGEISDWVPSGTYLHHSWALGSYLIRGQGRCADHPSIVSEWTSDPATNFVEAIYGVLAPTGPQNHSGTIGEPVHFTVEEATNTEGHPLEYRFGHQVEGVFEGSDYSLSPEGSITFSSAGHFYVYTEVRCSLHHDIWVRSSQRTYIDIVAP